MRYLPNWLATPPADQARNGVSPPGIPEFSARFIAQNAGKKSITLDIQSDQGRAVALKLIKSADILMENFSPGVAVRLGLGYTVAREYRKDIVNCALSGYGQDGPMSRRPALRFKWNQFALGPDGAPPRLGQHTVQALAALGLSELEIETLRITNVI